MKPAHCAHVKTEINGDKKYQSCAEHCRATARLTGESLRDTGLSAAGYLAGLIHDMGKFTSAFDKYICAVTDGQKIAKGSVNHTFAGVIFLFRNYYGKSAEGNAVCEILAYCAGSHHGLFDCFSPDGSDGFLHRIQKSGDEIFYDEAVSSFLSECAKKEELDKLFSDTTSEIIKKLSDIAARSDRTNGSYCFSLLTRIILSALIDGDRTDTAEFSDCTDAPAHVASGEKLWLTQLNYLENKLAEFSCDSKINIVRREISDTCADFAKNPPGIYRLNVPTGGGKTLSSLRFALAHAAEHNMKRIFFVIPLLSVIEQNSSALRDNLADKDIMLEHHSDIVRVEESDDTMNNNELLTENWQSPIVLTTLVQLMNTLFLSSTVCIRRMNALRSGIIIIDEIQSLPHRLITLFNTAVNFLADFCGCTVILCSATQPCFEEVKHPVKYGKNAEMVTLSDESMSVFKRTKITELTPTRGYTAEETADFAKEKITQVSSILIICNTKKEAFDIFTYLQNSTDENISVYHLSNSMCIAHRVDTLKNITDRLDKNIAAPCTKEKIICVSTQLVEAGIDFSFECVIRARAGLDNITQAAGRCNRNNEYGRLCDVYTVNIKDENLNFLKDIQSAKTAYAELYNFYSASPEKYGADLLSPACAKLYYQRLFMLPQINKHFDFPLPEYNSDIYKMLSLNESFVKLSKSPARFLNQAFKTAGDNFRVFDDNTVEIIVPYGNGTDIISKLLSEKAKYDYGYVRGLLKEASPYTVGVYSYQLKTLAEKGQLISDEYNRFYALMPGDYNTDTGIRAVGNNLLLY